MSSGNMREKMPIVAAWIDGLRDGIGEGDEGFGREVVDGWIRAGRRNGTFHATENGHEIGTPPVRGVRIRYDELGNMFNVDDPDAPPEPYGRRGRPVAWQGALDEQEAERLAGLNNNKG